MKRRTDGSCEALQHRSGRLKNREVISTMFKMDRKLITHLYPWG